MTYEFHMNMGVKVRKVRHLVVVNMFNHVFIINKTTHPRCMLCLVAVYSNEINLTAIIYFLFQLWLLIHLGLTV